MSDGQFSLYEERRPTAILNCRSQGNSGPAVEVRGLHDDAHLAGESLCDQRGHGARPAVLARPQLTCARYTYRTNDVMDDV